MYSFLRFRISVTSEPGNDEEPPIHDDYVEEGSTTVIVVIIIIVLLLIIGIAVGLYCTRKNKKCCFAPAPQNRNTEKGVVVNVTSEDQMTSQPLNYGEGADEGDKTTRPIIKSEWSRPT